MNYTVSISQNFLRKLSKPYKEIETSEKTNFTKSL